MWRFSVRLNTHLAGAIYGDACCPNIGGDRKETAATAAIIKRNPIYWDCKLVNENGTQNATDRLVDLGWGEGFFTSAFARDVARVVGMDVSKAAIKAASKRYRSLAWAVASTVKLPLLDSVFEIATVILAPFSKDIFRVVEVGGAIIRVSPGPNHLSQLKKLVYRDARPHRRAVLERRYCATSDKTGFSSTSVTKMP